MQRLLRYLQDLEAPTCDACEYPVPERLLTTYTNSGGGERLERPMALCPLCANNTAGSAVRYGVGTYPDMYLHQQINFVANAILDQLGAFDESP